MGGNGNHLMSDEQNKRFLELCNLHAGKIEKVGFQYGLAVSQSVEVTIDTFIAYKKVLETSGESPPNLIDLYKIAIHNIKEFQQTTYTEKDIFPFKEDEILHNEIIQIDSEIRIPLILSSFHGLQNEEIAGILDISVSIVQENLQTSKEMIGLDNLEQHLKLLNKSYERLPVQFNGEQLFLESTNEIPVKKAMNKKTVWSIVVIMALIIGASTLLSFLPKTIEHAASESVINELTEQYLEERAKRQELLQFTDERFDQLKFIQEADKKMYQMKHALREPIELEELELDVKKLIESIQLPSEMMEELDNHPLLMDEEKSIAHFASYYDKVNDLVDIYDSIIWDHREEIENFEADTPVQKAHMMMLTRSSFSDELQNVIGQMNHHSIQFCANPQTGEIKSCYYWSHLHERHMNNLHPHLRAYFFMLLDANSFGTARSFMHSYEIDYLLEAQYTLMNVQQDDYLYQLLADDFIRYFLELMKGTGSNSVFNERGIVKHEIQELWQILYRFDAADPLNFLLKPIFEEMSASGWTESEHWNALNRDKILEALTLGQEGKLEEIMYGKPPVVESHSISWPNEVFLAEVERLYQLFKLDYDKKLFNNLSPLYIVGVFDYANEVEDPVTMYHLFHESASYWYSESGGEFSLENYMDGWVKGHSFFEVANQIKFHGDSSYRVGENYYTSVDIDNNDYVRSIGVIIDREGVWHMHEARHAPLPKYEFLPETEIEQQLNEEILSQYYFNSLLTKDPRELGWVPAIGIAGLYFYTAEKGDFESQYKLLYQDDEYPIDKEEFMRNVKEPEYTMAEYFTSVSFQGQEQDENGNWPGIATFTVNLEKFPNEKPQKEFKMMWTRDGWRVQMNPMD